MRLLWGLVVGVIGCVVTYVGATKLGAIGEMVMGPTLGSILGIIVGVCGIAVTIALVIGVVNPQKKKSLSP
jgi:hypothetical protein